MYVQLFVPSRSAAVDLVGALVPSLTTLDTIPVLVLPCATNIALDVSNLDSDKYEPTPPMLRTVERVGLFVPLLAAFVSLPTLAASA